MKNWKYVDSSKQIVFFGAESCSVNAIEIQEWIAAGNTPTPADEPTLADVKFSMAEQIRSSRNQRTNGGFKVEVATGVFKWFHSDSASRLQQLGLVMAGVAVPPLPWKTMDGTFVTMTPAIATKIFTAAFALDTGLFAKAEAHKAGMEASATPATYDFSVGWPEHYVV